MLIYSEQRLVPTDVNMLVIRGKEEGYFYIHRSLYDQAVIINDIYKDTPELLRKAITGSEDTRGDVELFMSNAPSPINMLGPYLLLVKEQLEDFVDMVGAIHVMSGPINLRGMLRFPIEMRNNPSFSLSIKEEYELAWNRFFMTTMPFDEQQYVAPAIQPMNGTATVTVPTGEDELTNVGADGVEYADPLEALLFAPDEDIFKMPSTEEEEETTEQSADDLIAAALAITQAAANETTVEPEPVEEIPPVNKPKNGLDMLASGLI